MPYTLLDWLIILGQFVVLWKATMYRGWVFRAMERISLALPFGGRMHAPIPEQDMRERYGLD